MLRLAAALSFACWMLVPSFGFATDLGPPAAGFDDGGFTVRATLKGTTSQYRLVNDNEPPDSEPYRASFATGGVEGALGFQDRVRFVAHIGAGGFNNYTAQTEAPDGAYKV